MAAKGEMGLAAWAIIAGILSASSYSATYKSNTRCTTYYMYTEHRVICSCLTYVECLMPKVLIVLYL